MCTTSAECKTVIIAVLTVKSGMGPHMISQDFGWFCISYVVRISSWSWRFCGSYLVGARDSLLCHSVGVGCPLSCCPVGARVSL
jgi:hypothetical protein